MSVHFVQVFIINNMEPAHNLPKESQALQLMVLHKQLLLLPLTSVATFSMRGGVGERGSVFIAVLSLAMLY